LKENIKGEELAHLARDFLDDISSIKKHIDRSAKTITLRNTKILEALKLRRYIRVLKTRDDRYSLWVYRGKIRDYIIIRNLYCSCNDFLIRVIGRKEKKACYHLIGLEHAISSNSFIDLSDYNDLRESIYTVIMEVLLEGYSPTLRRLLKARNLV